MQEIKGMAGLWEKRGEKKAKMFQQEWEEGKWFYVYKPTESTTELNTEIKKRETAERIKDRNNVCTWLVCYVI